MTPDAEASSKKVPRRSSAILRAWASQAHRASLDGGDAGAAMAVLRDMSDGLERIAADVEKLEDAAREGARARKQIRLLVERIVAKLTAALGDADSVKKFIDEGDDT